MKLQIVEYVADEEGYRPEIRYEGGEANNSDQGIIGSTGAGRNNGQAGRLNGQVGYPSGIPATNSGIDGDRSRSGVSGYASGGPGSNIGRGALAAQSDRPSQEGYPNDNPSERGASAFPSASNGANSGYSSGRPDNSQYPDGDLALNGNDGYPSQGSMAGYPNGDFGPNGYQVSSNPTDDGAAGYPSGGPGARNNVTFGIGNSVLGYPKSENAAAGIAVGVNNGFESGYPNDGVTQNNPAQSGYPSGRPENDKNSKANEAGLSATGGAAGYPSGSPAIRGTGY